MSEYFWRVTSTEQAIQKISVTLRMRSAALCKDCKILPAGICTKRNLVFGCVYSCQTCLPCHIFFRSLRLLLQWRERALTACVFCCCASILARLECLVFTVNSMYTRRNSHKTKRFFPTDNPYIYLFCFFLFTMDGVEIFHHLNCFFPLDKPRLLILLSLYGYQPFFKKSIR